MSSASNPSFSITSIPKLDSISFIAGICACRSGGVGGLFALYALNALCLKVGTGVSKAQTAYTGFFSSKKEMMVRAKPNIAPVGIPCLEESVFNA